MENHIKKGTSVWLLHLSSNSNGIGWVRMVSLCCLRIQWVGHYQRKRLTETTSKNEHIL